MARASPNPTSPWPSSGQLDEALRREKAGRASAGHVALTVANRSDQPLTALHIVGALTPGWGEDWLCGVRLAPGEEIRLEWLCQERSYHLRVSGADGLPVGYRSLRPEPGQAWRWVFTLARR